MDYLLALTVGPVQVNIQESVKLKDLYNSSSIISDIVEEIKEIIKNRSKSVEWIYPNYEDESLCVENSNYLLCRVNDKIDLSDLEKIVLCKIFPKVGFNFFKETVHIHWAFEKLDTDYQSAFYQVNRKLRGVKNSYFFNQNMEISSKKCSVCGKRNIASSQFSYSIYDDQLCPICNHKRNYKKVAFESTYELSLKIWEKKYSHETVKLKSILEEIFHDISKYYKKSSIENVLKIITDEKYLKKNEEFNSNLKLSYDDRKLVEKLRVAYDEMNKLYGQGENHIPEPTYNYCVVQIDIDDLGEWMSGRNFTSINNLKNEQQRISSHLLKFSDSLKKELLKKDIPIIYAGGDDVMVVCCIEELLILNKIIEEKFKEHIDITINQSINYLKKMTYSMSISIAKAQDVMGYTMKKSREGLLTVKKRKFNNQHKNGIAISYINSSSKTVTAYIKNRTYSDLLLSLKSCIKLDGEKSFSYIETFNKQFSTFKYDDLSIEENNRLVGILKKEYLRLLKRSLSSKVNNHNYTEYYSYQENLFNELLKENQYNDSFDFGNLMNLLYVYKKLNIYDFE